MPNIRLIILFCLIIPNFVYAQNKNLPPLPISPPNLSLPTPKQNDLKENEPKEADKSKQKEPKKNNKIKDKFISDLKDIEPREYIQTKKILLGTGPNHGLYYEISNIICSLINYVQKVDNFNCNIKASTGSIENMDNLKSDKVNLIISQAELQQYSFKDEKVSSNSVPFKDLRFVFSLYDESIALIVKRDSDIQNLDDIKGRKIDIGLKKSGSNSLSHILFDIKNWDENTFKSVRQLSNNKKPNALCSGEIDAVIISSGNPNETIREITSLCETRLVDIDDQDVKDYVSKNKPFQMTKIPGGLYLGSPNDTNTFGEKATLLTTSNVSDNVIYQITKIFFENLYNIKKINTAFNEMNPQEMVNEGRIVPIHDGAMIYYKEKGYIK